MDSASEKQYRFDVALSFAREDRTQARELAQLLKARELEVFYDEWGQAELWGKNLDIHLDEIYRYRARFCVLFASHNYKASEWAKTEFASALSAMRERGNEYILPVRVDDVNLPGLPSGIGFLDLRQMDMQQIAQLVIEKLPVPIKQQDVAQDLSRSAAPEIITNPKFTRVAISNPLTVTDLHLTKTLLNMWPRVPPFERAKQAREIWRVLGQRESWGMRDGTIRLDHPYTCWRTSDKFFYSTLPGSIFSPQNTLEFSIINSNEPRLVLSAVWRPNADEWHALDVDEFHSLVGNIWADRSGCLMWRESTIHFAKHKRYRFSPPVVPFAGQDEALCRWTTRPSDESWFDWDRDPRLIGAGIANERTYYHGDSCCALYVLSVMGGWRNGALFEFHDTLEQTMPGRVLKSLCGQGCMRVMVFLCVGSGLFASNIFNSFAYSALSRINLAILRITAAQREYPLKRAEQILPLPIPPGNELRAFDRAVEAFGDRQFIDCPEEGHESELGFWRLKDFSSPIVEPPHGIWGASQDELADAVVKAEEYARKKSE